MVSENSSSSQAPVTAQREQPQPEQKLTPQEQAKLNREYLACKALAEKLEAENLESERALLELQREQRRIEVGIFALLMEAVHENNEQNVD